jgi:hypothetical protein
MEICHSNTHLSIYEMGDVSAFMMRDGMRYAPIFVIKGDAPLATCVFLTCIIRDVQ